MIYAAGTALAAKKAFGGKCKQSSMTKIVELLPIDPAHSEMEIVLLSSRDLAGDSTGRIQAAINSKHPRICVIYFPSNEKEAALLKNVHSYQTKHIAAEDIKTAVKTYYGEHVKTVPQTENTSVYDSVGTSAQEPEYAAPKFELPTIPEPPKPVVVTQPMVEERPAEVESKVEEEPPIQTVVEPILVDPVIPPKAMQQIVVKDTLEEKIANIKDFHDWNCFVESVKKDSITRQLLQENTEYQGIQSMLDLWEIRIRDAFNSPTLTAEEKFAKIKEFGQQRTALTAGSNAIYCKKLNSVIESIVASASNTVNSYLRDVTESVQKISMDRASLLNYMNVQPLVEQRLGIQLELMNMLMSLIQVYVAMDSTVDEKISTMTANLPTSNEFICEMLYPVKDMFLPSNSAELATSMMESLQKGNVTMSALESSVKATIELVFKLADKDEEIIAYQQKVIDLLRAHRVEDLVVRDSLIKDCLRLFVGADDSGRTATALAYAGMMSRRTNTLLFDFSKNSKLSRYGVDTISVHDFMANNSEMRFLCISGDLHDDAEAAFHVMKEIRSRISYYGCAVIILDTDQHELLDQFSEDALSVTYITNCTAASISSVKQAVANHTYENIAHKLVVIDAPISIVDVANSVGCDVTMTKVIPVPYIPEMRACCIRNQQPHEDAKILSIFEEAFR